MSDGSISVKRVQALTRTQQVTAHAVRITTNRGRQRPITLITDVVMARDKTSVTRYELAV